MRVVEAGDYGAAIRVDDLRCVTAKGFDLGIVADFDKKPVSDCEGRCIRLLSFIRKDFAGIHHDEVGGLLILCECGRASDKGGECHGLRAEFLERCHPILLNFGGESGRASARPQF